MRGGWGPQLLPVEFAVHRSPPPRLAALAEPKGTGGASSGRPPPRAEPRAMTGASVMRGAGPGETWLATWVTAGRSVGAGGGAACATTGAKTGRDGAAIGGREATSGAW